MVRQPDASQGPGHKLIYKLIHAQSLALLLPQPFWRLPTVSEHPLPDMNITFSNNLLIWWELGYI